jgi:hypothetical protein
MSNDSLRLDGVASAMHSPVSEYVALLRDLFGGGAKSLTLFGAVTSSEFDVSRDVASNVFLVESVDLDGLRRLAAEGKRLGKLRIGAPLTMTASYISESLDTFPLELLEISQKHVTVFGDDPFCDMKFEASHVRLQCERELKSTLIRLRQGLLAAAGRDRVLGDVEVDAGAGLVRTLRGMLWLKNCKDAKPWPEVVGEVEKILERKFGGVRTVLDPSSNHGWDEFQLLYRDVEALAEAVNAW